MKKCIPRYDKHNREQEQIYQELSKKDKQIIDKIVLSWKATAGINKVMQKRKNLIKIADILGSGLDKINNETYLRLAGLINQSDLADSTKNDLRKHLVEFLRSYYEDWFKIFNNFKELKSHKESIPKKYEDLPSVTNIEKLIQRTPNMMLKIYIQIEAEVGCRGSELIGAKFGDYNEEKESIKLISTKNKTIRILPLNKTIPHLKRWRKEYVYPFPTNDDFIFPNPVDRTKHISLGWINGQLRRLGKEILGRPISVYCIRHSVLTNLQKKLPAKVYEKVADHSIETASRYCHLNSDDINEAMKEFVYHVEELPEGERNELMKRIKLLEKKSEFFEAFINNKSDRTWETIPEGKKVIIPKYKEK